MEPMNQKTRIGAVIGVLIALPASAGAAEIFGGSGIGFDDSPVPWVSTIVFDKKDAKAGAAEFLVQTGDDVTPASQKETSARIWVPSLSATAWCDSYANPLVSNNQDFNLCYGNAWESNWYVLDLNALQKSGLKDVWVSVTAKRVTDGTDTPVDNLLIPALTVWQGQQSIGGNLQWFPQTFQTTPTFWANQLSPFTGGDTQSIGWASAYGTAAQDQAEVTGWVKLRPGGRNFLTVAVGGDARKNIVKQHTTDGQCKYALSVRVGKTKPAEGSNVPATAPQTPRAGGTGTGEGGYSASVLKVAVTNSLNETVQMSTRESGPWTDVKPTESFAAQGTGNVEVNHAYVYIRSSHGDDRFLVQNGDIGYPAVFTRIAGHGQWNPGIFDVGDTAALSVDGWSYTVTRHSDESEGAALRGAKSFELILKTAP
ncbi:MAG: hypothetical protein PHT19_11235 [Methylococcus sp.]|nr:hypothetical protein [Methylococcus sp.]